MLKEKFTDKKFWESFACRVDLAPFIQKIKEDYSGLKEKAFKPHLYSDRMIFEQTGSRNEFETYYFARRRFTAACAVLSLIYPKDEGYFFDLQNALWITIEEYSWALPAHCEKKDFFSGLEEIKIDLFAAETAGMLAEIYAFLGDRLDERVKGKILTELDRRIFNSLDKNTFWWESVLSNWVAVCGGNIALAAVWVKPEFFVKNKARLLGYFETYMRSIASDGTCLEGMAYWHFGFGEYLWTAEVVMDHLGGEIDLFGSEKFARLASYAQRNMLCGGASVSNADAGDRAKADRAMTCYLHEKIPDCVALLPDERMAEWRGNNSWLQVTRTLFYAKYGQKGTLPREDYFLPDAGQAIVNRENYSLFVKAGHNDEPHNHNDVGSFIFADNDGQALCDLGAQRYTREFFQSEHRYNFLVCSSRGHSLPIINGQYQKAGKKHCGTIIKEGDVITVECAKAYQIDGLNRLTRNFVCGEKSVTLTDEFEIEFDTFTERFVTKRQPVVERDCVVIGNTTIKFGHEVENVKISVEQYESHAFCENPDGKNLSPDGFELIDVYLLDFSLYKGVKSVQFEISNE